MNQVTTKQMGIAFMPGTFPTSTVLRYLSEWSGSVSWNRSKVNGLYNAYKDSILTDGLKPYGKGSTAVKQHLFTKYGYPLNEVTYFLVAIFKLVEAGTIKPYYLNFVKPKSVISKIADKAGLLDSTVKNIKFFSVIALLGVGLYISWPLIMKGRKIVKRKK